MKPQLQHKTPVWEKLLVVGLYLASLGLVIGLGFIAYLLIAGKLTPAAYGSAELFSGLQDSLNTGLLIFAVGLWLFALLGLLQWRSAGLFGWLLLVFGFFLYFAAPALINLVPAIDLINLDSPARKLLTALQQHGAGLICLGALRVVVGAILRQFAPAEVSAAARTEEAAKGKATSVMRNCWELGFCKSVLRQHCPRFLKRITCWKAKSGCYCDDALSRSLMVSARSLVEGDSPQEAQRSVQRARQSVSFLASSRGNNKSKPVCVSCPIYQDHQRYKYRLVAWLLYPGTAVITWFLTPFVREAWRAIDAWLSTIMGYAKILPTGPEEISRTLAPSIDFSWVAVLFVAALLLSLFMRFAEWLIMDRGL